MKLIGDDMVFPTLPVAEEAYVAWARAHPAPPPPTLAPVTEDEE